MKKLLYMLGVIQDFSDISNKKKLKIEKIVSYPPKKRQKE